MIIFLLAMVAAAPPPPAPKPEPRREVELGSRLAKRVDAREYEENRVREIHARYGECVVKKEYEIARYFVLNPQLDDAEYRKFAKKVSDPECLLAAAKSFGGVVMQFPSDTMRYSLAQALVQREFSGASPPSIRDAAPLAQLQFDAAAYAPKQGKKVKANRLKELEEIRRKWEVVAFLAGFGECVVRADPDQSRALLMSKLSSAEEAAAFKVLGTTYSKCVAAGQQLELNKMTVRGTIALNYYRLAHAPRQSAATAGATK